jgi:hypothetical protein
MNAAMIIDQMRMFNNKYRTELGSVVVGYGAAAVLHGLREETGDIDLDMQMDTYEWFNTAYSPTLGPFVMKKGLCGDMFTVDEHFDIHPRDTVDSDYIHIGDVAVVTQEALLRQYEKINKHPDRCPAKRARDGQVMARIRMRLRDSTRETRDEQLAFIAHVLGANVTEVQKTQNGNMFGTVVTDPTDRVWYVHSSEENLFHFKRFKYLTRRSIQSLPMVPSDAPVDMQFEVKVVNS